ncbi:MAG: hypothetical protein U0794_11320 [Isosphaeraceae bacterium]
MARSTPPRSKVHGKTHDHAAPETPAEPAKPATPPPAPPSDLWAGKPELKASMPKETKDRKVRVRMYRQGLGDCFLLRFPGVNDKDYHVLIDCGVVIGTPNANQIMKEVVADLDRTTGGRIDLLVGTHEHWDHLSAFDPAAKLFEKFDIGEVWLAWTEDPNNRVASSLRAERQKRLRTLWMGLDRLRAEFAAADAPPQGAREAVDTASEILGFFGIDMSVDRPPSAPSGAPAAAGGGREADSPLDRTGRAMQWLRDGASQNVQFRKPGEDFVLHEASGVRVYVLGPPTNLELLRKDLPTSAGKETYEFDEKAFDALEKAFFGGLNLQSDASRALNRSRPFDQKYQVREEDAKDVEFYRDHYYGTGDPDRDAWRWIASEWVDAASSLALKLDSDTNNTSLALAFELPDGRVLLFPGDAQVGNWESWHVDDDGKPRVWQVEGRQVTAESLLKQTVLYKVGHHGSHNATLREKGLEMMNDTNLTALVPVDTFVAHVKKRWKKMPFDPLMKRLEERAEQRVILADGPLPKDWNVPGASLADGGIPFTTTFISLGENDTEGPAKERPLYVEIEMDFVEKKGKK